MQICKFAIPELIFGNGALAQVGEATHRLGATRPLVVCDGGVRKAGWLDQMMVGMAAQQLDPVLWSAFTSNPKDSEITAGAAIYQADNCDAIIALGGGSCIDAAKAIAVLSSNGGRIQDYEGIDQIDRSLPPMVMVPTTAGSASDVSQFAAIMDTRWRTEMTLISRSLIPDISITDPLLLTTLGPWQTACTGMDALTHGIEAYLSVAATFLTDQHALAGIRLVATHLQASVADQQDLVAKEAMARGSLHAGLASCNAILGATHAMANQVGGMMDQVHGEVNAIVLPYVMEFNLEVYPERFPPIAEALGINVQGLSSLEAGYAAIDACRELARRIGLTRRLADLGVTDALIPQLSAQTMRDACMVTNPRTATTEEIVQLFQAAL